MGPQGCELSGGIRGARRAGRIHHEQDAPVLPIKGHRQNRWQLNTLLKDPDRCRRSTNALTLSKTQSQEILVSRLHDPLLSREIRTLAQCHNMHKYNAKLRIITASF